uniref:Plectin/eS10 N-terminal domain-containing protein n=1 Tax=Scophthalmus maximus TaxID=52904 RepID=A0A8D3DQP1_SCOMX
MLMPKKNRIAIYELLFKEGVMVAKKDVHLPHHPELTDKNVPNLHVMKAMQSLKSCGYVKEQFAWRHFYWYLTNEGIQYLRDFLHLPPEIVPATLRRQTRPETARPRPKGMEGERPARLNRGEADRDTYRRSAAPPGADKKAEAGAGAATEFQFVSTFPFCCNVDIWRTIIFATSTFRSSIILVMARFDFFNNFTNNRCHVSSLCYFQEGKSGS